MGSSWFRPNDLGKTAYSLKPKSLRLESRQAMSKLSILGEFTEFLKENKKLWLLPIIIVLVLLGALLVFAQTSALAPFIYTVF